MARLEARYEVKLDIIAALNTGLYLTGPYNALDAVPIPEPSVLVLMCLGALGVGAAVAAVRRRSR